jgi:2-polyprenyl-3-methyl-5-hydroxy-6-metoxy-1,4-benzoquinol methylase
MYFFLLSSLFATSGVCVLIKNDKLTNKMAKLELNYAKFRDLASNNSLSKYEKIGFPDSYRQGYEQFIFEDICSKVININKNNQSILDIGPGCSDLPKKIMDICTQNQHKLVFCDSEEMLEFHDNVPFLYKVSGMFPDNINDIKSIQQKYDVIICYSVFHYIFLDTNIWSFIDYSLSLLNSGGQFLIGDIPNNSKRKRFFSSNAGIKYHQEFTNSKEIPQVDFNTIEHNKIDDSVINSVISRAQSAGFDAYLMPQNYQLPMSNRRDDILITRP